LGDQQRVPEAEPSAAVPVQRKAEVTTLRALMDRGVATFGSANTDAERLKGVELVFSAAAQGFSPARKLIVHNYPRSPVVRARVPATDVMRFALEPLASDTLSAPENRQSFIDLARYFSAHKTVTILAELMIDEIRRDRRLQTPDRLGVLIGLLSGTPGACTAIAHIVSQDRAIREVECAPDLRSQILTYVTAGATNDPPEPPFQVVPPVQGGLWAGPR